MHTPTSPSPSLPSLTLTTPLLSLLLLFLPLLLLPYLPPTQALRTTVMEQDLNKAGLVSSTATEASVLTTFPARSLLECASSCAQLTPCWALTFSPGQQGPSSPPQPPPLHSCSCYSTGTFALPLSAPAPAARTYAVKGCVESACPEISTTPENPTTTPEIPTTTKITTTTTKTTTTPAVCPQPPNYSGRYHRPGQAQYDAGDQVTYKCIGETDGGGNGLHVCDSEGKWKRLRALPECD